MSKIVIGNWKMNGLQSFESTFRRISDGYHAARAAKVRVALCPPATLLSEFAKLAALKEPRVLLGGQYCHPAMQGSHTGDISALMLRDAGAALCLVGHAERRAQGENDTTIGLQLLAALKAMLTPVLCIGERASERSERDKLLARQLEHALSSVPPSTTEVMVAYEPVWAIGSGERPSTKEITTLCRSVGEHARSLLSASTRVSVLYGGSVAPENASEILAATDGVLVGSASLEADKLLAIADAAPV